MPGLLTTRQRLWLALDIAISLTLLALGRRLQTGGNHS